MAEKQLQEEECVPEPSVFMELEPEGRQVAGPAILRGREENQDLENGVVLLDSKSAGGCGASLAVAEVAKREFSVSDRATSATTSSPSIRSAAGSVTSSSDAVSLKRQLEEHPSVGRKKRGPRKRTSVMTTTTTPNVSSTQFLGKRRRKSSSTLTASSANTSPTSSLSSLFLADSMGSKTSQEIPAFLLLPLTQSTPTRPSIIRYANSSAVDSSSEQSSTTSAYSPMHPTLPFPGTVQTPNSRHHQLTAVSVTRSSVNGFHSMFNKCNLVTRRSSDRAIASWSSTTVVNGPRYNLNQFRPGPGFIELGALIRSRIASSIHSSLPQFHRIQVGHRQGTSPHQLHLNAMPSPPSHQPNTFGSTVYSFPQPFDYVTVPVHHDNLKTDRTIRCFGCQDVLNRVKIPLRGGRRHVSKVFKPETYYCKYCLDRKFTTQDHYEYC